MRTMHRSYLQFRTPLPDQEYLPLWKCRVTEHNIEISACFKKFYIYFFSFKSHTILFHLHPCAGQNLFHHLCKRLYPEAHRYYLPHSIFHFLHMHEPPHYNLAEYQRLSSSSAYAAQRTAR